VDQSFGTGAVKITPGHDFADFEMGRRHRLPQISVIDARGRMAVEAGPFHGQSREDARKAVVAQLESQELLDKIVPHQLSLGRCSRCDTVVDPRLSYQWFMAVNEPDSSGDSLAGKAIHAVEKDATKFFPKFWENTYFAWMRNLQDWCISRQLWWGHRIPAYWCESCHDGAPVVAEGPPSACPRCGSQNLRQDDDVLDTWFSSGLWPFSTLGWPDQTPDLQTYYPTSVLITGFDIIFFWVARMMMFGLKVNPNSQATLEDRVPFRDVYITPLVRDQYGKKMTKSRGNVVDPLDIMEKYGTDAVRFTLAQLSIQGRDLILSDDRLAASRAFANKIWNAARFILMNLDGAPQPLPAIAIEKLTLVERWILSRLDTAIKKVTEEIGRYEFNNAALTVYRFIWHEFCDWYIELAKKPLKEGGDPQAAARYVLVTVFDRLLRILHPFMPFISEELWQAIRPYSSEAQTTEHLAVASWPVASSQSPLSDREAEEMARGIEATEALNRLRSLVGSPPGQKVQASILRENGITIDDTWVACAMSLAKVMVEMKDYITPPAISSALGWATIAIYPPDDFDFAKARASVRKRLDETRGHLRRHKERYENPGFRAKADPETVAEIADKIEELTLQTKMLEAQLEQLH
jgi:valyl-tRNA synthetase